MYCAQERSLYHHVHNLSLQVAISNAESESEASQESSSSLFQVVKTTHSMLSFETINPNK